MKINELPDYKAPDAPKSAAAPGSLDEGARTAVWYAIEEVFGGEQRDNMANLYWSDELEVLDDRVRKRLRLLTLGTGRSVPKVLQNFIIRTATTDQLLVLAEEALMVAVHSGYDETHLKKLADDIEVALRAGGVEATFQRDGKLVVGTGVDATPRVIGDLPLQAQFKTDLSSLVAEQVALIFIDLDNFKAVNDTNGHAAGDACLAKVVEVIGASIAGKGKLYRYGGDEFAVILRNANVDEGAATAERIRVAIQSGRPGGDIAVTASIGVASSDQPGLSDPAKLLDAADAATYSSKHGGKNRVTKSPN